MAEETREKIISETVDEIMENIRVGLVDEGNFEVVLQWMANRLESIWVTRQLNNFDKLLSKPDEDDVAEYERQREHNAKREREYQQTGYWSEG